MHDSKRQLMCFSKGLLSSTVLLGLGLSAAQAFPIDTGDRDVAVRFDNTFKYNYGVRTESADNKLLETLNSNDGDYNFRKAGTNVTNRVDLLTEFDVVYKRQMGFRVSAASWYDKAYENVGSNSNFAPNTDPTSGAIVLPSQPGLSNYTDRYNKGVSGEILDAFVFGSMQISDMLASGKAGRHNLYWGESLLNPVHGISYGQSSLDLAKLASSPGTEAKELFIPRNQLSVGLNVNPELSFAAQYFLDWEAARLSQPGTFYGNSDVYPNGAQNLLLGYYPAGVLDVVPVGLSTRYNNNYIHGDKRGDYGLSAHWAPEWLDGDLGFYYRNTQDILPQAVIDLRQLDPTDDSTILATLPKTSYTFAYGDDIHIYGISLSKSIDGISYGMDVSYRENMPLNSIPTIVSPVLTGLVPGAGVVDSMPGRGDTGGAIGNTGHLVLNALTSYPENPLWDTADLLGELYASRWFSVTKGEDLFKGADTYTGIDKVTRSNYGLGLNFTPTWFQVLPSVDLKMPLSITQGLHGYSAVSGGGAVGAGNYAAGFQAIVDNRYIFDLKYVDYYGKADTCNDAASDGAYPDIFSGGAYACTGGYAAVADSNSELKDRGAVYFTFRTTL